jgi:hypothetical protein
MKDQILSIIFFIFSLISYYVIVDQEISKFLSYGFLGLSILFWFYSNTKYANKLRKNIKLKLIEFFIALDSKENRAGIIMLFGLYSLYNGHLSIFIICLVMFGVLLNNSLQPNKNKK